MTALVYRIPADLSEVEVLAMFSSIERETTPLAVMPVREQLWCRGGAFARLSHRLSRNTARNAGGVT